ncbi:MAG: hypothetical protein AAGG75_07235 [Bacteroidota bacterium]
MDGLKTSQKNSLLNSRLIRLLSTLNEQEFRRLGKFVRSPFYNYSQPIIRLYEHLKPYYPAFEAKGLQQQRVWKKVFPKEAFHADKLWRFLAKMNRLVERFLAVLEMEREEETEQRFYIRALGRRNLFADFEKATQQLLQKKQVLGFRDPSYYVGRIQLLEALFFHPLIKRDKDQEALLNELSEGLDNYFILSKLRVNCVMKNRDQVRSTDYTSQVMDIVDGYLATGVLDDNLWQQLYSSLRRLQFSPSVAHYQSFKALLFEHLDELRSTDQRIFFYGGLNYPIRQINAGDAVYYKEAFYWYKRGLKVGLTVNNNRMSAVTFSNIILLGCRDQDFEWTNHFIEDYQKYLDESIRQDMVLYNRGQLYFYQKDFEATIACLSAHNFKQSHFMRSRLMIIRATYELFLNTPSHYNLLMTRINTFEKYLYRRQRSYHPNLESCINATKIIKGISTRIFGGELKSRIKKWAREALEAEQKVMVREWLEQKVATL